MNKVIVIVGATGVGKTDLSIKLAKYLNVNIVNADASQFKKELNIGTSKITNEEMDGVKHYLIDIINPNDDFSIYDFQVEGRRVLNRELENNNVIVVGGSGLYINALLTDYDLSAKPRDFKEEDYKDLSNEELFDELLKINPELANKTHMNNRNRVIRYLELSKEEKLDGVMSVKPKFLYDCLFICLNRPRDELYERINKRVELMFDNGWIDEVKSLIDNGVNIKKIKEIGYLDIYKYLNNELSYEDLISLIAQKTRNYAKRQLTWIRNKMDCVYVHNFEEAKVIIDNYLK